MNRQTFSGHKRLHRHARIASRWRRRSVKGNRDSTSLFTRSNPGTARFANIMQLVRETAAEFKRKYGGQAVGWAADAASTARDAQKARFFRRVTDLLRHDQYATNPKRYSRQKRKGKKHGSEQKRATGKLARANKRWRHLVKRRLISKGAKSRRRANKWDTSLQYWGDKASDWYARRNPKRDGTPTRGEKRKDKYKDHLRALRERGDKASAELNKLLGRGVHKPHGDAVLKAPRTETQEQHPGHFATEQTSDQKFAQEQLSQVEALMADVRSQMSELGDADEALADELSDQLVKLGDQRRALQARAKGTPAMSNPGRGHRGNRKKSRGGVWWVKKSYLTGSDARVSSSRRRGHPGRRNPRYTSPARYRRMSTAQRARYRQALRQLRYTIHSFR